MDWKKITSKGLRRGHYKADALILYCSDDRGREALSEFILKNKFRHYDLVIIPGGAKALSGQNGNEKAVILEYISKLMELHLAKEAIIFTHVDCGACGGSVAFGNDPEKERESHRQWLEGAKNCLREILPDIPIKGYFVDFEGIWQVDEFAGFQPTVP
ncbi:MAG: hypothetical protein HYT36_02900 [Candidatus Staskawiczbacteria bacterium]|nr:hypothetical protein [Candidatus Staskawiczbacteria bacterium]